MRARRKLEGVVGAVRAAEEKTETRQFLERRGGGFDHDFVVLQPHGDRIAREPFESHHREVVVHFDSSSPMYRTEFRSVSCRTISYSSPRVMAGASCCQKERARFSAVGITSRRK